MWVMQFILSWFDYFMLNLKRWNLRVGVEHTTPPRSKTLSSSSLPLLLQKFLIWALILQNFPPQCQPPNPNDPSLKSIFHPSKIKKSNQSYTTLYLDRRILYYILVRTIYSWGLSKETTNDTLFKNLYYIMEGYSINFAELILEYMTKVCKFLELPFALLKLITSQNW